MRDLFEAKIHGIFFENSRLIDLQNKSIHKGLKGDEVFEFIYLDRWEQQQKIDKLEEENEELKAKVEKLESKLIFSHSFILNLMDNWNYLRDVLSNVSTEEYDDGQIEWTDCCDLEMDADDFYEAKRFSENFAMGNFKEWFHEIKVTYGHKSLDDHEDFKYKYWNWRRGLKETKEGEEV